MTDTGCKSVPPLFWSFSPSLRRACLLYFCNDFFLQFAFLNDISFLSENGLEWREGRCRSADKSAWDMSRHTAGYRSAEAVLRTNQDHFSAFAIIRFRSRNPVTFVVAKMVHGQAHKRRPPSRHVVDAYRQNMEKMWQESFADWLKSMSYMPRVQLSNQRISAICFFLLPKTCALS